jgi:hypothetical protein
VSSPTYGPTRSRVSRTTRSPHVPRPRSARRRGHSLEVLDQRIAAALAAVGDERERAALADRLQVVRENYIRWVAETAARAHLTGSGGALGAPNAGAVAGVASATTSAPTAGILPAGAAAAADLSGPTT